MKMVDRLRTKFQKLLNFVLERTWLLALVLTVIIAGFTFSLGTYNNKAVPINPEALSRYTAEPKDPLKNLADWDGTNYIKIATSGYTSIYQTNFFPFYPLLTRLVHKVISSPLISAIIVAWLGLFGAVYLFLKLLKKVFKLKDNRAALYGLVFFVLFPTAIWLVGTYNTSILAFFSLATIYFAMEKRALFAGISGFFATLTHFTGLFPVLLAALILFEYRVELHKIFYTLLIGVLGIGSYMLYLHNKFHNALAFVSAQKSHGWLSYHLTDLSKSFELIYVPIILLILLSIAYWWNKKRIFSLYSFLFLLIPILGGQFGGFNRYCILDFPIMLMAYGYLKDRRSWYTVAVILTTVGWAYYALQYMGGYVGG